MPKSTSPSDGQGSPGGPLVCPRCALTFPLSERFCSNCGMPLVYAGRTGEEPITASHERRRKVKPQYTQGEAVKVAWARNQSEGELIQGFLLEEGIPSILKRSRGFDVPDFLAAGPRDVMVPEAAAEAARGLLRDQELINEGEEKAEMRDQAALEAGSGRTPATQLAFWVVVAAIVAVAIVYGLYRLQG